MSERKQGLIEQLIRGKVAEHPDQEWLLWRDETFSWADTLSNTQRVANGLLEQGVRPGDKVAIMMGNRPEFLWTHFAANFIGASSVPINIAQRGPSLVHILADSGSSIVVVDGTLSDIVASVRKDTPSLSKAVVVDGKLSGGIDFNTLLKAGDGPLNVADIEGDASSAGTAMLYTSGTTGPPKGVVQKSSNAASGFLPLILSLGVKAGETIYTSLPLFHGNALLISTMGSIVLDTKLALGERFSASRMFSECKRYNAVEFNALGGMISILLKQPPSENDRDHPVRVVLSAGCPADKWEEFEKRFGVRIVEFYGMVDAPGLLLNDTGKVGSMGKPIGECEFAVMDENSSRLEAGQVGELVFRHPSGQLSEYHNLPDATKSAWEGGWFHTGDLAMCDAEGYYYYRGRKKESIRRLGENISAWEIETVVNSHPKVLESAAHPVPSELGEDEVKICVVPRPGETIDPVELISYCEGKIARYAIPRFVEIMDELPKTGTQRVRYQELKERGITAGTWDRLDDKGAQSPSVKMGSSAEDVH